MPTLSAQDIIRGWEWGQNKHPLDRSLFFLALAYPNKTWEELASLSIGQRNLRMLALREQLFGPTLNCFVECSECSTALEFTINVSDIRVSELSDTVADRHQLSIGGVTLQFRLPNSQDLAAIVGSDTVGTARRILIQRCVEQVSQDNAAVSLEDLPETIITALAEQMINLDPQAELRFNLSCEACGHDWSATFDIASFFWVEISTLAKRLLQDVYTLAQAYGWPESDILAMSDSRRRFYLEMIG